jgi:hypothetical protein
MDKKIEVPIIGRIVDDKVLGNQVVYKNMEKFNQEETIKRIEKYLSGAYNPNPKPIKKVFYHWTEWEGWRFYKKALLNSDFKSIIGHIKSKFQNFDE